MINYQDFIHPEDETARRNMEAIPGFAAVVKAFLKLGMEQYYHGVNMGSKIRLSEKQLPDLYLKLPPICPKLNILVTQIWGLVRQSSLDEKTIEIAEASIQRQIIEGQSTSLGNNTGNFFCTKCGTPATQGVNFCGQCGFPYTQGFTLC
jgi:hypothetical protein